MLLLGSRLLPLTADLAKNACKTTVFPRENT
jgi:hypothetical protein